LEQLPEDSCASVPVMANGEPESVTGTIAIEMRGTRVRVSGVVDAAALQQVLGHLGSQS
jgi:hypothetical protein